MYIMSMCSEVHILYQSKDTEGDQCHDKKWNTCIGIFFFSELISMYESIKEYREYESCGEYPYTSLRGVRKVLEPSCYSTYTDRKTYSDEYIMDIFVCIDLHESPYDEETYSYDGGSYLASPWEESMRYRPGDKADTDIFDKSREVSTRESHRDKEVRITHDYVGETLSIPW
jgi:hypothetical protein